MTLAPTTQTLERAIRSYVAEGSGLAPGSVIPGNAQGPAPTGPYGTVVLISEIADGHTWTNDAADDNGIEQTVYESVTASYSVQFFRADAYDRARQLRVWAQSPTGKYGADRRGFSFYSTSSVRQISEIVSEEWEQRAGIDLDVGIVTRAIHAVDSALTLDILVEHDGNEPFVADPAEAEACQ